MLPRPSVTVVPDPAPVGEEAAYLAERYWPGVDMRTAQRALQGLVDATLDGTAGKSRIFACAFVPGEEAIFLLIRARSVDDVQDLGNRAGISFDRIVGAVVVPSDGQPEEFRNTASSLDIVAPSSARDRMPSLP
jgi:hypothetical protein